MNAGSSKARRFFLKTVNAMTDNPRIAELRRRVEKDPTSIAFAQLAEEYRRIGDYQEAVKACRDGLARHPGYLSAQVTLGRALMELKDYDAARAELEAVLQVAPDNLAAIRALADIHERRARVVAPALAPPPVDFEVPSLEETSAPAAVSASLPPMPDFSDWTLDTDSNLDLPDLAFVEAPPDERAPMPLVPDARHHDPVLDELEQWLTAIVADRAR